MTSSQPYRVLARKYRPDSFKSLIGQEAMVRTLKNAFTTGRIAQAYMLTGVRGVGKTTTARILARAFNYKTDTIDAPTVELETWGEHCQEIIEGRHIDVIEMDAASHTGIDDIRDIIESSHYRPAAARYKVYIIDEVHMLSNQAFNGLLKTLEEPPAHVKFIFATTEIRKVPITVLSRCQRFDLKRIEADTLREHLAGIIRDEGLEAEDAALQLVARAGEGSARDALSLLDQAIAYADGTVTAENVAGMLGLAGREQIFALFEALMAGEAAEALAVFRGLYDGGTDPSVVVTDLLDVIHLMSRFKTAPKSVAGDAGLSLFEREMAEKLGAKLAVPALSMVWQMALKALPEIQTAPRPAAAADMLFIRIAYAAMLPSPADLAKKMGETPKLPPVEAVSGPQAPSSEPPPAPLNRIAEPVSGPAEPAVRIRTFGEIVDLAFERREMRLAAELRRAVRPGKIEPGRLEIGLTTDAPKNLVQDLTVALQTWTGQRWMITVSGDVEADTIAEIEQEARNRELRDAQDHPLVRATQNMFPGAKIVDVRTVGSDEHPENPMEKQEESGG